MARKETRKLHAFVKAFISTDKRLAEVLSSYEKTDNPLIEGMRLLIRAVRGEIPAVEAITAVKDTSLDKQDPYLAALFLWSWAEVSITSGRLTEARAAINRAKAIIAESAPAEIATQILHASAKMASFLGDKPQALELHRQALALLPSTSPKRGFAVLDYATLLALMWREPEMEAEIQKLLNVTGNRHLARAAVPRFFQYVETGLVEEALSLIPLMESDAALVKVHADPIRQMSGLLGLMRDGTLYPDAHPLVIPVGRLLAGGPEEALDLVRSTVTESLNYYLAASSFLSFNLIRAELACGHGQTARRILEIRSRRGNAHPLDDFFMARAELLAGNRDRAAGLFRGTLDTVDKHKAHGRLDFELRLACELSPADVLRMMRAPAGVPKSSGAPAVASPAVSPAEPVGVGRLLGPSAAMQSVCEAVRRFAALDAPVLITGETGTGKELVARALHDESPRSTQPFVAINCGAIAESLLESELFGHERGAFTGATQTRQGLFEQAGTGTILLDEIGDIPPRLQVALLRVLEVGEIRPVGGSKLRRVGCRILAATNAPLDRLVEEGRFRQDLLYRLKRLEIRLSPLRERREDILPLASHFLGEGRTDGRWPVLSPELREELSRREWPGNVRELKNVIELMRLLGSEKLAYEMADLEPETSAAAGDPGSSPAGEGRKPEAESRSSGESPKMKLAAVLAESRSPLRRLERLREAFRQSPTLTRQEVIRFLGISHATATHDLAMLSAEGLIEKVRPTPSPATHYFRLRPSGSAADRRLEAADAQEESTLAP